jgi:TolA-binding protein
MKKLFLFLPLLLLAEIDPFNAGLNSSAPYGLTPQEKAILNNKKKIDILNNEIKDLKSRLDKITIKLVNYDETINSLNERLSAFNTLLSEVDSTKQAIKKLQDDFNKTKAKNIDLENRVSQLENKVNSLQNEVENIKLSIKEITKIQNENFKYLKNAIDVILKEIKQQPKKEPSPAEAMKKAKKYFYSGKLDKAKELFIYTLSKRYLPATSAYYLGEIEFKKGNFNKALAYYKKSVEIYPKKTSFTERLLYHTAISFEKTGNKTAAKMTLQKLINDYPNSKYAKLAKKELEKLK